MEFLVVWIVLVIAVCIVASNKKRSVVGWGLLAFILTPLVGIILLCLPSESEDEVAKAEKAEKAELRACPFCAEEIKAAARICKHCRHEIEPIEPGALDTAIRQIS